MPRVCSYLPSLSRSGAYNCRRVHIRAHGRGANGGRALAAGEGLAVRCRSRRHLPAK